VKYRIIATVILLSILGLLYAILSGGGSPEATSPQTTEQY